jgi:hypothetical protein
MKLKEKSATDIASALVEVFDWIYTCPLWSWRALLRSISFSVVVTIVYAFEYLNARSDLSHVFRDMWIVGPRPSGTDRLYYYGAVLITNAVTDYVSLFIIRPWLKRAGPRPALALLSGALLGVPVVCLGAAVRAWIAYLTTCFCELHLLPTAEWPQLLWGRTRLTIVPALVVFAWLPLLGLGILTVRILSPLSWVVSKVQWGLKDGSEHPLKAVAVVAAASVFIVGIGVQTLATGHGPPPQTALQKK